MESYSPTLDRAVNSSDGVVSWTGPYDLPCNLQEVLGNWDLLGTVDVPAGGTMATFSWNGLMADTPYEWYASATDGFYTKTASTGTFTMSPELSTLVLSPTSVTGGAASQGTVTLSTAAPAEGAVVTLSDDSSAVTVPASVTVPGGSTSTTFTINTASGAGSAEVTISGSYGGVTKTATLTVTGTVPFILTYSQEGTGSGTVSSTPQGMVCNSGCSSPFFPGDIVSLAAAPAMYSHFTGWSGICAGTGVCTFAMNDNASVTATFNLDIEHSVRIDTPQQKYFSSITGACIDPLVPTEIKVWGIDFTGDIILDYDRRITLRGGYNGDYTSQTGMTYINGTVTIKKGSTTVEYLTIR